MNISSYETRHKYLDFWKVRGNVAADYSDGVTEGISKCKANSVTRNRPTSWRFQRNAGAESNPPRSTVQFLVMTWLRLVMTTRTKRNCKRNACANVKQINAYVNFASHYKKKHCMVTTFILSMVWHLPQRAGKVDLLVSVSSAFMSNTATPWRVDIVMFYNVFILFIVVIVICYITGHWMVVETRTMRAGFLLI
jgi:hypothetical protein